MKWLQDRWAESHILKSFTEIPKIKVYSIAKYIILKRRVLRVYPLLGSTIRMLKYKKTACSNISFCVCVKITHHIKLTILVVFEYTVQGYWVNSCTVIFTIPLQNTFHPAKRKLSTHETATSHEPSPWLPATTILLSLSFIYLPFSFMPQPLVTTILVLITWNMFVLNIYHI